MSLEAAYAVEVPSAPLSGQALSRMAANERHGALNAKRRSTVDRNSEALVRIGKQRDREAFAQLFSHFAPRVKAYLIRSGASEALAEDSMQEAMVTVWHKASLFDPSRASAATWIFTIARNKQLDAVRKLSRPEPEALPWGPSEAPDPAREVEIAQDRERLREALGNLPDRQRALIEKAYYGDLSHREIGQLTGLPLGTVKSRIRLALSRLRHDLKADTT